VAALPREIQALKQCPPRQGFSGKEAHVVSSSSKR
jgi:hypothetical protein